jgi:hypothetical protein
LDVELLLAAANFTPAAQIIKLRGEETADRIAATLTAVGHAGLLDRAA